MRQLYRMAIALTAMFASVLIVSGEAGAAGYPPPPVNTSCSVSVTVAVGSSITVIVTCTFAPGHTITITLNGHPYSSATAPSSGVFTEVFTATDPHISMNGGSAEATSVGAVNTFVATGDNSSGGTNTATTLVTVLPPSSGAASASGGAGSATAQPFAFTGADIAEMTVGGLVLIALGFVLVVVTRRRKASASAE